MRPDIGEEVRNVVAELQNPHRGPVLRLLRIALLDVPIVHVERALGWSRQRLGRAEKGGPLSDDERAELMVHYGACVEDVRRALALLLRSREEVGR